jgi:sec-independent protein translocase protein TatA
MPGPSEWIIVGVVAVAVLFGFKKIPEIARSLGRSQGEFKKGLKEGQILDSEGKPVDAKTVDAKPDTSVDRPSSPSPETKAETTE